MGFLAISHRGADPEEFRGKVHELKQLAMEICEDTEAMFEEFGERNGGDSRYRTTYGERNDYGQRGRYRDPYMQDMQERYRRY